MPNRYPASPATTEQDAVSIARQAAEDRGWPWEEPIVARLFRPFVLGQKTWEIHSNDRGKGYSCWVRIVHATGQVISVWKSSVAREFPFVRVTTAAEAIAIARRVAESENWPWEEPVMARKDRLFFVGRAVWEVHTNGNAMGRNVWVRILPETGEVTSRVFIPR